MLAGLERTVVPMNAELEKLLLPLFKSILEDADDLRLLQVAYPYWHVCRGLHAAVHVWFSSGPADLPALLASAKT